LQDLRCRHSSLVDSGSNRLVAANVHPDHGADDSGRDQGEQRRRHDQSALLPLPARLCTPQLRASVGIDRLEDVPRGQGVGS
jgi:hypothetical protein